MSIQNDTPERQKGADLRDACETRTGAPTQAPGARLERDRSRSATTKGRFSDRGDEPAAPADLSRYRAAGARGRTRDSAVTETAIGLPLMLDAVRAVLRDELGELRRELTTQFATADEVLTMNGVAKLLGVSSKTVLKWIRTQGLPASGVGVQRRFRRSEVIRWIGEHRVR